MEFNFKINRVVELEETASTQDVAKALAGTSALEDCVLVQAQRQSAGRGRYERTWDAKDGGLYISLLLNPGRKDRDTSDLSIKTGKAVALTLSGLYGIKTKIKLPNDVLALHNGEYKKISGILIETAYSQDNLEWLVIGIGVNLNNKVNPSLSAASVKQITGETADIAQFRTELLKHFSKKYLQWKFNQGN